MNTYSREFRLEDGILYIRLSGKYPEERLKEAQNLFQPVIDECSTCKCNKVLIDTTDIEVDFVVLKDEAPLFAIECRTGEKNINPALFLFNGENKNPENLPGVLREKGL